VPACGLVGAKPLTDSEWITATDPQEMLLFLRNSGGASERTLRLFAAACVRRVWHLLTDERSREAIEVSERYADGLASEGELRIAWQAAWVAAAEASKEAVETAHAERELLADELVQVDPRPHALGASQWASTHPAFCPTTTMIGMEFTTEKLVGMALSAAAASLGPAADGGERIAQAVLLRDMLGPLPFRPVTLPPSVRTWDDGTIPKLAEAAYQERALPSGELDRDRLAVLADALEEVGADDLLLGHLRGPGPRVRGDWVVDLLTSRE
jgi:hypothetical protein